MRIKKTILLIIIFLSCSIFYPSPTSAQSESTVIESQKSKITNNIQENMQKSLKTENISNEVVQDKKQNTQEKMQTFRERLQIAKEERKAKIEEMKINFKEKRDAFKEKIETIKDERKKQLTEKIDSRMLTINKNQTDRMMEILEKLTEHIDKLQERIIHIKENGIDVSLAETAISSAQVAIGSSVDIVEQQAAKDYVFSITEEEKLGEAVKVSYGFFNQDLKTAQRSLVIAKEAVVNAYKTVQTLRNITPTVSQTVAP